MRRIFFFSKKKTQQNFKHLMTADENMSRTFHSMWWTEIFNLKHVAVSWKNYFWHRLKWLQNPAKPVPAIYTLMWQEASCHQLAFSLETDWIHIWRLFTECIQLLYVMSNNWFSWHNYQETQSNILRCWLQSTFCISKRLLKELQKLKKKVFELWKITPRGRLSLPRRRLPGNMATAWIHHGANQQPH